MKEKSAYRQSQRRIASTEVGLPPGQSRLLAAQSELLGQEHQAAQLPLIPADTLFADEMGRRLFMVDFDPVDGGAPLG